MSIVTPYQRNDGRWAATLTVDGVRKTVYGKTEREVKRNLQAVESQVARTGSLPDSGRRTMNDLLDLWLETADLRPATLADYRSVVDRYVRPALGRVKLARLDPSHLQSLCNTLRAQGLRRIPHLVYTLLHRALVLSVLWGWLPANPADRVLKPRYQAERKDVWSEAELARFLEGARAHRLYPFWVLALASGCRYAELAALRWTDVDPVAGTLAVARTVRKLDDDWVEAPPKTRSGRRSLVLPEEGLVALRRQRLQQAEWRLRAGSSWSDRGLVFSTGVGTPLDRSAVDHALYRVCARLHLARISVHALRHLHASLLLAYGLSVPAVSARLGHANPGITMTIYAHALGHEDTQAAAILQRALGGDGRAVTG